jgi:hypothetical protein
MEIGRIPPIELGEVIGSRKKLQGKDLQKQKRCGLLECSREDVKSSLAGGGKVSTATGGGIKAQPGLSVRGSPAWIRWIRLAAAREQRSTSSLIEAVLVKWARSEGLQDPPPRSPSSERTRFL